MTIRNFMTAIAVGGALAIASPRAALADAAKGAEVYKMHQCAMCHKVNGSGGTKGPICPPWAPRAMRSGWKNTCSIRSR